MIACIYFGELSTGWNKFSTLLFWTYECKGGEMADEVMLAWTRWQIEEQGGGVMFECETNTE
jgi:hypothetical protein